MVEVGILREPEPFELIGGELVAMAPKDRRHEVLRTELALYWGDRRGRDLKIASRRPCGSASTTPPSPTSSSSRRACWRPTCAPTRCCSSSRLPNSSLPADLNTKAPRYAAAGVREYWVINARSLLTTVFREPHPAGEYGYREEVQATQTLVPTLAPTLAVRLADLGLA